MISRLLRSATFAGWFPVIVASVAQAQTLPRNGPIANDYVAVWTSPAPTEETGGPVSMIQLPSGRLIVTFTNWRRVEGKQVTTDKVYTTVDWCFAAPVADAGDVGQSRHNVAAVIDGNHLHFVSRTAGPAARNAHSADLVTFHTVEDFRSLVY